MSTISPTLRYRDPKAAIDFLVEAFGFERALVVEDDAGTVQHAELRFGDGYVMFGGEETADGPFEIGLGSGSCYLEVTDPDALFARARDAGATIVYELRDQPYGSREFGARDPEGNLWFFGTYVAGSSG